MPLPITTTSAVDGRRSLVRWPSNFLDGSRCQYERVLSGVGNPACPAWSEKATMSIIQWLDVAS